MVDLELFKAFMKFYRQWRWKNSLKCDNCINEFEDCKPIIKNTCLETVVVKNRSENR